jgi:putative copper export protein
MGLAITHYALKKRATKKKIKGDNHVKNHSSKTPSPIILIPLVVIIIISSINLYSNIMISHSNALPFFSSLAISMDWIHFMAVSIWIGGLFFLSTILLKGLKSSLYNHRSGNANTNNNYNKDEMKNSIKNTQHTLILLTYFSLIAIVSLTIIGITGMYLGLVHLQSINAVFNTAYGNILIIKLSLAFPLIFLGRYNQLKIQKYAKSSKNILIANFNNDNSNTPFIVHNENSYSFFNTVNRSIKIESIIGISVLVAASFLSVTSPPSLSASTQDFISNGNNNNNNAGATSTSMIASDFSALAIILSVVILVLGIINFRKNQQNINDISITD